MNIGGFISRYKEKARQKRISTALAKAETKKAELKKIKEESDAVRGLRKTEATIKKEKEYLANDRKQNSFFNKLSGFDSRTGQAKTNYKAKNILKDDKPKDLTSNDLIDDRYAPRGIFSSGKKPRSPFM